jgi:hypothetical protein
MMDFDLSTLVSWARRAGGDRVQRTRETISSDGTATFTLGNDGFITLARIRVDGDEVDLSSATLQENDVTLGTAPVDGAQIDVIYGLARYSDAEVIEFLCDAAGSVASDLHFEWTVSLQDAKIVDLPEVAFNAAKDDLDLGIQRLIVLQAALALASDKGNQAADDAIVVRDNKTLIDTSKASASSETSLKRFQKNYDTALLAYRRDHFKPASDGDRGCRGSIFYGC